MRNGALLCSIIALLGAAQPARAQVAATDLANLEPEQLIGDGQSFDAYADLTEPELPNMLVGTEHLDAAMAKFYIGLGAAELFEALRSGDRTILRAYLQTLNPVAHPETYLGFVLFSKVSGLTEEAARGLLSQQNAQYLGLAAGSIVLDLGADIYLGLKQSHYFELKTEAERRTALRQVYSALYSRREWRGRAVRTLSLVAAAGTLKFARDGLSYIVRRSTGGKLVVRLAEENAERAAERGLSRLVGRQAMIRGLELVWNGSRLAEVHPVLLVAREVLETTAFVLVNRLYDHVLEPRVEQLAASKTVGHVRETLGLAEQYALLFAPASQRQALERRVPALAQDLTLGYQEYAHALLAPVLGRYYRFLARVGSGTALDETTRAKIAREYAELGLREGLDVLNREELSVFAADRLPSGVHASYVRELGDLRLSALEAGSLAGMEDLLGPALARFDALCRSRHYNEADTVLSMLEADLDLRLDDLKTAPTRDPRAARAAALVPGLLGELREVARKMTLADKFADLFKEVRPEQSEAPRP